MTADWCSITESAGRCASGCLISALGKSGISGYLVERMTNSALTDLLIKRLVRVKWHHFSVYRTQQPSVEASVLATESFDSDNALLPKTPYRIPWTSVENSSLAPGASFELPIILHANKLGEQELCFSTHFPRGMQWFPGFSLYVWLTSHL
jgi:hypothetical protein